MGQFKPMVKMMTTEPSIELKLKKGGHVAMPKMKAKDHGTGSKKMADGGMSGVLSRAGLPPGPVGGAAPAAPSMAARRKAMMGRKKADGGDALKKHAALPASKAHKGLKTGGVAMGQGGYKNGGSVIPVSASKRGAGKYEETLMHTAKPDRSPAKTGDVKMGNGGGYKKGGNVKKMAMGGMGQLPPPTTPRTGGGTPKPAPTMKDMIGRARTELMPKKPTLSGADYDKYYPQPKGPTLSGADYDKYYPQPKGPTLSGADYDKYMPGGPNNPLKPGRGGGPKNPGPMPLPRRGSGPNDAGPMGPRGPKNPGPMPLPRPGRGGLPETAGPMPLPRKMAKGGGVEGNVSSSRPGVTNTTTGEVRKGNAGGFKKGGAPKKFARGGSVNDSGKAVAMPQGYKKPPTPVSINQLSGTYKKGGKVRKYAEGGMSDKEQAKAYDRFYADEAAQNKAEREAFIEAMKNPLDAMRLLPERLKKGYEAISKGLKGSGSVTTTEREVSRTVTPAKKRSGGAC
jgi:hypothetical protein